MQVNKVSSNFLVKKKDSIGKTNNRQDFQTYPQYNALPTYPLPFLSRVDKDLNRFYEFNKDRMPKTVKDYVESLEDKNSITPLEAQYNAFGYLALSDTVEDIKSAYPDEPLFADLLTVDKSNAPTGIIRSINENKEILSLDNKGVLKNDEDFTVYLVKKIFLDLKTVDEINKDLENDLNENLKADFRFKYGKDSKYIHKSTLDALNIHRPDKSYRNSLRFTQENYADDFAQKVAKGVSAFYNSLSPEERTARAKKSAIKFETWWNTIPMEQKLEMISKQDAELEMLANFKNITKEKAIKKEKKVHSDEDDAPEYIKKQHVHVGSERLSNDDLFKRWATNNIKIFEAQLSAEEKAELDKRRMVALMQRWSQMSSAEKTEYLSKLKTGGEIFRYVMIDAWNNSPEIIVALSKHLKSYQVYKPTDLLYSTEEFKGFQSEIMSKFWDSNPEFATLLGENIKAGYSRVKNAIAKGTFILLQQQLNRERKDRIRAFENGTLLPKEIETVQPIKSEDVVNVEEEKSIKDRLIDTYRLTQLGKLKSVPPDYFNDYYGRMVELLPEDTITTWLKVLSKEEVSAEDKQRLKAELKEANKDDKLVRYNRAMELALAEELYSYTENPRIYELSGTELKTVAHYLEKGADKVEVKNGEFKFRFIKPFEDTHEKKLNNSYARNKQDITESDLCRLSYKHFTCDEPDNEKLDDYLEEIQRYIASYGQGVFKILSRKSIYPIDARISMYKKFLNDMPDELKKQSAITPYYNSPEGLRKDEDLNRIENAYVKKYSFLPREIPTIYLDGISQVFNSGECAPDDYINKQLKIVNYFNKSEDTEVEYTVYRKNTFDGDDLLKMLAIEQAMADMLYISSGYDENVYNLNYEDLCNLSDYAIHGNKYLKMVKKNSPVGRMACVDVTGKDLEVCQKAKYDPKMLKLKYNQYIKRIEEFVNENDIKVLADFSLEDLLFILNPREDKPLRDEYTINRLKNYGIKDN